MTEAELTTLRHLLTGQPVAALATLHRGRPAVSMVPFALAADGSAFVIHVSRLATHTADMQADPEVALLVTASLDDAASPLALPRVSIQGRALPCPPDDPRHATARAAYLARLPDAERLFDFPDFSLFRVEPRSLRIVIGFGRAWSIDSTRLRALMTGGQATVGDPMPDPEPPAGPGPGL